MVDCSLRISSSSTCCLDFGFGASYSTLNANYSAYFIHFSRLCLLINKDIVIIFKFKVRHEHSQFSKYTTNSVQVRMVKLLLWYSKIMTIFCLLVGIGINLLVCWGVITSPNFYIGGVRMGGGGTSSTLESIFFLKTCRVWNFRLIPL